MKKDSFLRCCILAALMLAAFSVGRTADAAPPNSPGGEILRNTFTQSTEGWTTLGKPGGGTVAASTDGQKRPALRWDYALAKGDLQIILLPVSSGLLARMESLRFVVEAGDNSTPLVVVLQEKNGGRYSAIFTAPAGKSQTVELAPADFVREIGADAPKDPDNKLDPEQVEAIGITDLAQVLVQGGEGQVSAAATLFGIETGPRHLFLRDFVVSTAPLPRLAMEDKKNGVPLDGFLHPQIGWMVFNGTATIAPASAATTGVSAMERALRAEYHQSSAHPFALVRPLLPGILTGEKGITMSLVSQKPVHLTVQIEEKSGGKWSQIINIPGQGKRTVLSLLFADFKPTDDSKDDNNKLDLENVSQIVLVDISGMADNADDDNALRIGGLKTIPADKAK